jgi:hypothetical protein
MVLLSSLSLLSSSSSPLPATLAPLLFLFFLLSSSPSFVSCGPHERRLLNDLLTDYTKESRPVAQFHEPVSVIFGLDLQQIIDLDENNQARERERERDQGCRRRKMK